MPFQNLIKHYKGSAGSGDWGHTGRPGKVGGSSGGGGKFIVPSHNYMMDRYTPDCGDPDTATGAQMAGCDELRNYTGIMSMPMNRALRGLNEWPMYGHIRKSVGEIDAMFDKAKPIKETITVTRGLNVGVMEDLQLGDSFTDKGFVSTTIAPNLEAAGVKFKSTVMTIKIPKGAKGLYIGGISAHPDEQEFLLPRDSKFVIDAKRDLGEGKFEFDISLVRQ